MCECCLDAVAEWVVWFRTDGSVSSLNINVCTDCLPVSEDADEYSVQSIGAEVAS